RTSRDSPGANTTFVPGATASRIPQAARRSKRSSRFVSKKWKWEVTAIATGARFSTRRAASASSQTGSGSPVRPGGASRVMGPGRDGGGRARRRGRAPAAPARTGAASCRRRPHARREPVDVEVDEEREAAVTVPAHAAGGAPGLVVVIGTIFFRDLDGGSFKG